MLDNYYLGIKGLVTLVRNCYFVNNGWLPRQAPGIVPGTTSKRTKKKMFSWTIGIEPWTDVNCVKNHVVRGNLRRRDSNPQPWGLIPVRIQLEIESNFCKSHTLYRLSHPGLLPVCWTNFTTCEKYWSYLFAAVPKCVSGLDFASRFRSSLAVQIISAAWASWHCLSTTKVLAQRGLSDYLQIVAADFRLALELLRLKLMFCPCDKCANICAGNTSCLWIHRHYSRPLVWWRAARQCGRLIKTWEAILCNDTSES